MILNWPSDLSLWKASAPLKPLEARIASQAVHYCGRPFVPHRSIIQRLVQPGERPIVLAKAGVYDHDVERISMYSSRAITQRRQYSLCLIRSPSAAEHVTEKRLYSWPSVHRDPLQFRDCLRPHLLARIALSGNCARR